MEIKNDTIYQIKTKVLLYKNKKYFPIFRNIFINNTLKYIFSKNKTHMISNQKIKEISNQNKEKVSLWLFVTKNIMKETNIIDYDLNNYRMIHSEENEDEYFLEYLKEQNKVLQISNLVFLYLNRISIMKLNKLQLISLKDKIPLINLMKIYLGLCSQNISYKKKRVTIKEDNITPKSFSKKLTKKFTLNERNNSIKEESKIKKIPIVKIKKEKKLNESIRRSISINQSKIDEENEKEKNDSGSLYDEMINEQIQRSINKLNKKNKNSNNKILYSSSFARLFIGETDKESIREKYLSNFEIKKEKKLKKNKDKNLSSIFFKVFLSRMEQNKNKKLPLIEKGVENIFVKFKKNQEIIDKFSRLKNKNLNPDFYNDVFKRLNRTTTNKIEKINYNINNNANKNNKFSNLNRKKNIHKIKLHNKLTKTILNSNKINDKLDDINKNNKYKSLSNYRISYKNKEKEKIRFIHDYNSNSNLKNYLNLNQNYSLEKKLSINNIKKKLIRRQNDNNNDIVIINGNLTTRNRKEINNDFWKHRIFKQENEQGKNDFINYLNKKDLFYENL